MDSANGAIQQLILATKQAEATAYGEKRREAYRTTRYLLAGCRSNGISMSELATLLGASAGSVRARSSADGIVSRATFASLASITLNTILRWEATGILPPPTPDERGHLGHAASTLVATLLKSGE